MKLKILVKIVEKLLGEKNDQNTPRADMYLPEKLLAMSIVFLAAGIACTIIALLSFARWAIVGAVLGLALGISAILCWKNQTIHVISDQQFTYTTMFGKTFTYSFADIQGLRKNQDSITLFVAGNKVHIESMAILSERFINLVNQSLAKKN